MNKQLEKALIFIRASLMLKLYLVSVILTVLFVTLMNKYFDYVFAANPDIPPDDIFDFSPVSLVVGMYFMLVLGLSAAVIVIALKERKIPILVLTVPLAQIIPISLAVWIGFSRWNNSALMSFWNGVGGQMLADVSLYTAPIFASPILIASLAYNPPQKSDIDLGSLT
jgi:hypothetical protein